MGHVDHSKIRYSPVSTLGGIFSPVSGMHGHILMQLIAFTHCQFHMNLVTFFRYFQKCTFVAEAF